MRRGKPGVSSPVQKATKRTAALLTTLQGRGAFVTFTRLSARTRVAIITDVDGWETLGVAHTQGADVPAIGDCAALEDACGRLGSGRFFAGNDLGR